MKTLHLKALLFTVSCLFASILHAQTYTLKFKTNYGNFEAILYDFTPQHRDLILSEVAKGTYKNAEFNRVIQNFVIQGGELDETILKREALDPDQKPMRLSPEFHPKAFHKLGALGAGRDNNPTKGSYFNQIYFVVGKRVNLIDLETLEKQKGIKFTAQQKEEYLKNGGLPRLDHDYTVFGEITKGLPVVLKISREDTDANDVPEDPIIFTIKVKKNNPKRVNKTSFSIGGAFTNFK